MKVSQSVGIITGGASGLGAAVARMIVQAGGRVVLMDLPSSEGERFAAELGDSAVFVAADITKPEDVESGVAAAEAAFGRLDLLLNAAGIAPGGRLVNRRGELFPLATFEKTVAVNLTGLFDVTRHVALSMTRNDPLPSGERGLIVNVSSIAAFDGQIGQVAYTASKGAVAAMTLQLARDLAEFGIRVMCIAPGIMHTPMVGSFDAEFQERLAQHPLFPKRLGEAAEFAELVRSFMEIELLNAENVRLDAGARMGA